MKSRSVFAWLCVLLLVLAQHAALAHGVSHLGGKVGSDEPSLPFHGKVCEQCHQASQMGAGMAPALLAIAVGLLHHAPEAGRDSVFQSPSAPPFSSRAPPIPA